MLAALTWLSGYSSELSQASLDTMHAKPMGIYD